MIDLSSPENYHIVSSTVLKFLHHVKSEEGVCAGCFRDILCTKDIEIQTILNELTIFCCHCGDLVYSVQVLEMEEDAPITEDEITSVRAILRDPDFEKYLHQYIQDVGPTI